MRIFIALLFIMFAGINLFAQKTEFFNIQTDTIFFTWETKEYPAPPPPTSLLPFLSKVSYNGKIWVSQIEPNVLSQYINSPIFNNFATSERYSIIINGVSFKNGIGTRFEYKGTPTVNLTYQFDNPIEFPANVESNIYLMINPMDIFKSEDEIYDPSDDSDHNKIDDLIKSAIKAIKKNN